MASPHVAGAAALLLAQNPNLTVQQLKALLIFNGDLVPSLASPKTLTGRRLNVNNSLVALAENDTTPPGSVTGFNVLSQSARTINLSWTTSGDDGNVGTASLYQLSFIDADTGTVMPLKNVVPLASGMVQTLSVKLPIGHSKGTITLREFDNVGNEGTPVSKGVSINFVDGNPYAKALGKTAPLSTGGTPLGFNCDDCFKSPALPFTFPFFGQNYTSVTISSNGNIYFTPPTPPTRPNGDADDVPGSTGAMANFKMIAGLWDDLYLKTDQRADADVYMVKPDANTVIFRWQGVPCNDHGNGCTFGGSPVNFEIELRSNGTIQTRYGSGNTGLFPVVGISGGEADPYVMTSHTSETISKNLTNASTVTYIPRTLMQPQDSVDFFVTNQYRDFLSREPDTGGLGFWIDKFTTCAGNQACINATRIDVSNQFFFVLEYQQTGSYVYRVYRAAFGNNQPFPNPDTSPNNLAEAKKLPNYQVFAPDRTLVVGSANLAQSQLDYANAFVARPEFLAKYPASLPLDQFVQALLDTIKNDIGPDLASQKSALVGLGSRGAVLYRLADDNSSNPIANQPLLDAEYNRAVVYTQYAGYLRRNADIGGFKFWLGAINAGPLHDLGNQRTMVCFFITSTEFQQRFSSIVTHGNGEC
jgi:hypothetical protein